MTCWRRWPENRIRGFQRLLLDWYAGNKRELPWRSHPTPYRVWISEIMLQQTQVRTVFDYYGRFLARFPDLRALAEASEDAVVEQWAGLGYYHRARNLHRAARKIVGEHGGKFPRSMEEILKLPGIGRYTAGAILSIAFNRPQPAVDGNVRRVISRLLGIEHRPPERFFREQASSWLPPDRASDFNQALMELGALLCVPAEPRCMACPVLDLCEAQKRGTQRRIPPHRSTRTPKAETIVILVATCTAGVLVTDDRAVDYIPGKWSLPILRLGPGTAVEAAACGFAGELLGKTVDICPCTTIRHSITYRRIKGHVFHARVDGESNRSLPDRYCWMKPDLLAGRAISSLVRKALRSGLGEQAASSRY